MMCLKVCMMHLLMPGRSLKIWVSRSIHLTMISIFVWSDDGSKAFFSSDRPDDGSGLKDLYTMDLKLVPYDIRAYNENRQLIPNASVELTDVATDKVIATLEENANQDRISFYMAPKVKYKLTIRAPGYESVMDEAYI